MGDHASAGDGHGGVTDAFYKARKKHDLARLGKGAQQAADCHRKQTEYQYLALTKPVGERSCHEAKRKAGAGNHGGDPAPGHQPGIQCQSDFRQGRGELPYMGRGNDACAKGDPDDRPLGLSGLSAICHTRLSPARLDPSRPVSDPA